MVEAMQFVLSAPDRIESTFPMLLEASVKAAVILAAGLILVCAARRASAGFRHALLSMTVLASLLIPAISMVTPQYRLPFAVRFTTVSPAMRSSIPPLQSPDSTAHPAALEHPGIADGSEVGTRLSYEMINPEGIRSGRERVALRESAGGRVRGNLDVQAGEHVVIAEVDEFEMDQLTDRTMQLGSPDSALSPTLNTRVQQGGERVIDWASQNTATLTLAIWLFGALLIVFRSIIGLTCARWIASRAWPVRIDERIATIAHRSKSRLRLHRAVNVLISNRISTPVTWGFVRPIVLLPAEALAWTDERVRLVFLHEFAHVKRSDWLIQMLARTACAVYWFNPLMWYAMRRLSIEREQACDDDVLAMGTRPSDYARHLLDIARALSARTAAPYATLAMARRSELEGRLMSILNWTRNAPERRGMALLVPTTISIIGISAALAAVSFVATPQHHESTTKAETHVTPSSKEIATVADESGETVTFTGGGAGGGVVMQASDGTTVRASQITIGSGTPGATAGGTDGDHAQAHAQAHDHAYAVQHSGGGGAGHIAHTHAGGFHGSVSAAPDGSSEFRLDLPHEVDGNYNLTLADEDATLRLEVRGYVVFDPEKGAITKMGPGASVKLNVEYRDGRTEELFTIADVEGGQHHTWKVNGETKPFEADESDWRNATIRRIFVRLADKSSESAVEVRSGDTRVNLRLIELHRKLKALEAELEPMIESDVEELNRKVEPMMREIEKIQIELEPIEEELAPAVEEIERHAAEIAKRAEHKAQQIQEIVEVELAPMIDEISRVRVEERVQNLQKELEPLIAQLAEEATSGNLNAERIETFAKRIEELALQIEKQAREIEVRDIERLHEHLRRIAPEDLEAEIERSVEELEPMIERIAERAADHGQDIERHVQEHIAPMEAEIERMSREIENRIQPMIEKIESVIEEMKSELADEVSETIRNKLNESGFGETHNLVRHVDDVADEFVDDLSINIDDDELRVSESGDRVRRQLEHAVQLVVEKEEIELTADERGRLDSALEKIAEEIAGMRFALSSDDDVER